MKLAKWAFELRLNDVDKALRAFVYRELNYKQMDSLEKKLKSFLKQLHDAKKSINLNQ